MFPKREMYALENIILVRERGQPSKVQLLLLKQVKGSVEFRVITSIGSVKAPLLLSPQADDGKTLNPMTNGVLVAGKY